MSTIPKSVVENRVPPFPTGSFVGKLAGAEERVSKDGLWKGLELQWADNEALNGAEDPGNRKFYNTITIQTAGEYIGDIPDFSGLPNSMYGLVLGAGLLGGLALAFGAAVVDGDEVNVDLHSFIEDIKEGRYEGEEAVFNVRHRARKYTDNDGEEQTVTEAEARRYLPAR